MAATVKRKLIAVSDCSGIITVITEDGSLQTFRQTGITGISTNEKQLFIAHGMLVSNWASYPEIPSSIGVSFEDPSIQGRVRRAFPYEYAIKALSDGGHTR